MNKTLYKILGILDPTTPIEDIKKNYRKLSKQFHPDRNSENKTAEAMFKEIQEAWDVLSDPDKRAYYDKTGEIPKSVGKEINHIMSCLAKTLTECVNEQFAMPNLEMLGMRPSLKGKDVLLLMRTKLNKGIESGGIVIDQLKVSKTELEEIKDKFLTDEQQNHMHDLVCAQITEISRQIEEIAQTIQLLKKSLDFLKSYRFKKDERPDYPDNDLYKMLGISKRIFQGEQRG